MGCRLHLLGVCLVGDDTGLGRYSGLWRMMMREGPELLGAQRRVCRPSPDPHPGLWRVLAHSEDGDGYGGTSAVHVSRWKCDASKDRKHVPL